MIIQKGEKTLTKFNSIEEENEFVESYNKVLKSKIRKINHKIRTIYSEYDLDNRIEYDRDVFMSIADESDWEAVSQFKKELKEMENLKLKIMEE